tara:strand:+ start:1320 stop:1490 length:171 start_codon:yes stop_codon:yes gene_type:complete
MTSLPVAFVALKASMRGIVLSVAPVMMVTMSLSLSLVVGMMPSIVDGVVVVKVGIL